MSGNSGATAGSPSAPQSASPRLEVVAAVITRRDGSFLLGQRPAGKVYAGYWEFPGGKVEPGEAPLAAIGRELNEELGIEVRTAWPWLTRDYDYAHAAVRLRFFRVTEWSGTPHGRESQRFTWQLPDAINVDPLLPANGPILRALKLPPIYALTNAAEVGERECLARLDRALTGGLKLIQVREKAMPENALAAFAAEVVRRAHASGARVLVNGDASLVHRAGADGVHLTSTQLRQSGSRPDAILVGASCHDAAELERAHALGADFAVLGPVQPTPTHPDAAGIAWEGFAALLRNCALPVYAIGGMTPRDLEKAWRCGAHGISMMRGAWNSAG
jgi:8-oxo-dGTP diphosphatase